MTDKLAITGTTPGAPVQTTASPYGARAVVALIEFIMIFHFQRYEFGWFSKMGAYTLSMAGNFNGFPIPEVFPVVKVSYSS